MDGELIWVAVDIGCIECGERSSVLGIFATSEEAQAICDAWYAYDGGWRGGQHSYEVFSLPFGARMMPEP